MNEDIFKFDSYRKYLRKVVRDRGERGFQGKLAEAAGCQPAYLSRVLADVCHLTPDHAMGMAIFLGMAESEEDYFLTLVQYERAGTQALKARCRRRLEQLKDRESLISAKSDYAPVTDSDLTYYTNWIYAAIHVLANIPDYQVVGALASRLNLDRGVVEAACTVLEKEGFLKRRGGKLEVARGSVHAPEHQVSSLLHLQNWRNQAVQRSVVHSPRALHFTGLYHLSHSDVERTRATFFKLLNQIPLEIASSPDEEAVCLNVDFFSL